ncbi:MAG: phytoene/squalene synthase family protein [Bacteroidales bacterium]|nr:phytoene/squalene synthase family protein [Bacteroidales bacterium]
MSNNLYIRNNLQISKLTTRNYSTSFSLGVRMLNRRIQNPIYAIYGFVRYADEIVDTFHDYPQQEMLDEFIGQTYQAIERGISMNPILDSFQWVVNIYGIEKAHIDAFLKSMRMDLDNTDYDEELIGTYIYGSAEVVGLMCLRIFCHDDDQEYEALKPYARKLGEAFQKVNFLRDINSDYQERGRTYFTRMAHDGFTREVKEEIERDIEKDFREAYQGIRMLNKKVRFGVYLAYMYYMRLFKKIRQSEPNAVMNGRLRIANSHKLYLLFKAYLRNSMNML